MFQPIHKMIPFAINHLKLKRQTASSHVCHVLRLVLQEKFGPEITSIIYPLSYKNGVLAVSVPHSVWAQELQLAKASLLAEVEQRLKDSPAGTISVKQIRIVIRGG